MTQRSSRPSAQAPHPLMVGCLGGSEVEQIDISVRELVDMIDRGELRLPELQRRYVWPATRVRDLLDSLYRGYPSEAIRVGDHRADAVS